MGGKAVYTFTAAELRSQGYSPEHAAAVEARGGVIAAPRKAAPVTPPPPPLTDGSVTVRRIIPDNAAVRAWAQSQGRKVSPRGRIPAAIIRDYIAANAR